jgi:D-glycerate 3-kinase
MIPDSAIDSTLALLLKGAGEHLRVLGITGPPGTGKSSLALRILARAQSVLNSEGALISLDDVYFTRDTRQALATSLHPLAAFRGPPGTHDLDLLFQTLRALERATPETQTRLPRFDKLTDDRKSPGAWPVFVGRPSFVVIDGWCLGALPVEPGTLAEPINERERNEDPDGRYRHHGNESLEAYHELTKRLTARVHLHAEWDDVLQFREEQEQTLEAISGSRYFSREGVLRFLQLFERIARGPYESEKLLWTAEFGPGRTLKVLDFPARPLAL